MNVIRWLIMALLIGTPSVLRSQPTNPEWTVLDVAVLDGAANPAYDWPNYLLSPDGSTLAWIGAENNVCQMALASEITTCHPPPPQFPNISLLAWSPNGQYLLLLDGFGEFSAEFTFEISTGDFQLVEDNRTITSSLIWNTSSDAIYYLSYEYENNLGFNALRRFSTISNEETVFEIADIFQARLLFDDMALVSPDDTEFALLLRYSDSPDVESGLWRVNIDTQKADYLASYDDLAVGLTPEAAQSFRIADMAWDQKENRLLVITQSTLQENETFSILSVDLATGAVTPLLTAEDSQPAFSGGTLTSDGKFFFYFDELDDSRPIFVLPLASLDHEPIPVTQNYRCPSPSLLITLGQDDGSPQRYIYEPHFECPR